MPSVNPFSGYSVATVHPLARALGSFELYLPRHRRLLRRNHSNRCGSVVILPQRVDWRGLCRIGNARALPHQELNIARWPMSLQTRSSTYCRTSAGSYFDCCGRSVTINLGDLMLPCIGSCRAWRPEDYAASILLGQSCPAPFHRPEPCGRISDSA